MRRVLFLIISFALLLLLFPKNNALAAGCSATFTPATPTTTDAITVTITNIEDKHLYDVFLLRSGDPANRKVYSESKTATAVDSKLDFIIDLSSRPIEPTFYILEATDFSDSLNKCFPKNRVILPIQLPVGPPPLAACPSSIDMTNPDGSTAPLGDDAVLKLTKTNPTDSYIAMVVNNQGKNVKSCSFDVNTEEDINCIARLSSGPYILLVQPVTIPQTSTYCASVPFTIGSTTSLTPIPPFNPTKCDAADASCSACVGSDPTKPQGIPTALGCIPTNLAGFVGKIFAIILGLAGGIALILIIYSGYRLATEGSDPDALKGARETLTSAIVGLLFIIFSFVILEVIGVNILRLPQFGGTGNIIKTSDGRDVPQECRDDAEYAIRHVSLCGGDLVRRACDSFKQGLPQDIQDMQEQCDRGSSSACKKVYEFTQTLANCQGKGFSPECFNADFALRNTSICGDLVRLACGNLKQTIEEIYDSGQIPTADQTATVEQCRSKGF